mgnify:CR=1 FL=1
MKTKRNNAATPKYIGVAVCSSLFKAIEAERARENRTRANMVTQLIMEALAARKAKTNV